MDKGKVALELFNNGYNCAQAVVLAFKDKLNLDEQTLKSLSSSFGGGLSRLREVCGCVSAMGIVLGLLYGNYDVNDVNNKANHYKLVQDMAIAFKEEFGSYNCATLLNLENKIDSYVPSIRSKEYYEARPCGKFVYYAATLLERKIESYGKN